MGYWIYKDAVTWTARVHRDNSKNRNCKWKGAEEGTPPPPTWEYVEELPVGTVRVESKTKSKQVHPMPCDSKDCMNGKM